MVARALGVNGERFLIFEFGIRNSEFGIRNVHPLFLSKIVVFESVAVDLIDPREISVVRYAFCRVEPEFGRGPEAGRRINGT
jgi:hypothetical protein